MSGPYRAGVVAAEIRAELAAVTPQRACCRRAQAAAFDGFAWRSHRGRQAALVRTALRLGHRPGDDAPAWRWEEGAEHCRVAYLRGLFLIRGSLSLGEAGPHLEFVLDPDRAAELVPRLREIGLPAALRLRRGRGVVTWKSADTIMTFLRLAGAGSAVLDLEARRVARGLHGELNRVLNAESANLARTVDCAFRQLQAIDALAEHGGLAALSEHARRVAIARREAPAATLAELADSTGLHRSAVQRELRHIEQLAMTSRLAGSI